MSAAIARPGRVRVLRMRLSSRPHFSLAALLVVSGNVASPGACLLFLCDQQISETNCCLPAPEAPPGTSFDSASVALLRQWDLDIC